MYKLLTRIKYLFKNQLPYNIRRFFKPYNVIKIRDMDNYWHDVDDKLFLICRQLLIDFVELEKPFCTLFSDEYKKKERLVDINEMQKFISECQEHLHNPYQEILDLYKWFKIEYPILQEEINFNNYFEKNDELYKLQTQKMIQLISLRKYLWT